MGTKTLFLGLLILALAASLAVPMALGGPAQGAERAAAENPATSVQPHEAGILQPAQPVAAPGALPTDQLIVTAGAIASERSLTAAQAGEALADLSAIAEMELRYYR